MAKKFRIKGTFASGAGGSFVRYWCNNNGLIGWVFPEVKERANTYTKSAGEKFIAGDNRNHNVKYELEPVEGV